MTRANILYLPHGGGPLPLLGDPGHAEMVDFLAEVVTAMPRPEAILVVSAHWEEARPTVTGNAAPELIYDYYGFPPESYEIRYPAPGSPTLAEAVRGALAAEGIDATTDARRGFDHGLFVPLKLLYPDADIPCIQLSLVKSLDPGAHIAIGRALASLTDRNLLVIGSGLSFHNMQAFFATETDAIREQNLAFDDWLHQTCIDDGPNDAERAQRLTSWQEAPAARFNHPREEHLLPLHVCLGMADCRAADRAWRISVLGKRASAFLWAGSG